MQPRIETNSETKLVGQRMEMSFSDNTTMALWRGFMPRRNEILHIVGAELYSMQIYRPSFFPAFDPTAMFEKWAAVEVADFENIPEAMETFILPTGLYAVFNYKGAANDASNFYYHIHKIWLPASDYVLDNRPHFEILGEKYKNNDPDSEEEIWIPVRLK